MMNIYKAAILSFFLPIVTALLALYMPDENVWFTMLIIGLYVSLIILYTIMLVLYKKKKRKNAARIIITLNMILFSFYLTFPMMKLWMNNLLLLVLLAVIFFVCTWLAVIDQNSETPIVLPENREKKGVLTYIYYAIPVILVFIGGGGNFIIVREMHLTFGDPIMRVYGSVLFYLLGCWLGFFMASIYYKGLVKEGRMVK